MTIKEIERMASGDYFMIRMERINTIKRNMSSKTEREQAAAAKEIRAIAKEIKAALEKE